MSKILLDPKGFQGQIDSFESGSETIKGISYNADAPAVRLQSIDKYIECIVEFNNAIELFGQMLDLDTNSMKQIKAAWMGLDSDIATQTLGQILFGTGDK